MKPWELLDTARIPGSGGEIRLFRRDTEYSIRIAGFELMNSRVHGSEDDLARLAMEELAGWPAPRVLIGGLGIGFTVAAALLALPQDGTIEVVELVPAVVDWHREYLAPVAGRPLDDPRVSVTTADVAHVIGRATNSFDAIVLDVDNGPEGLIRKSNDRLYSARGLEAVRNRLRPGGILAVWSATPDDEFTERLEAEGFDVEITRVRPGGRRRGARHTIWIATKTEAYR